MDVATALRSCQYRAEPQTFLAFGALGFQQQSSSAVVILGSLNTLGHSPKASLVATTIEVRS